MVMHVKTPPNQCNFPSDSLIASTPNQFWHCRESTRSLYRNSRVVLINIKKGQTGKNTHCILVSDWSTQKENDYFSPFDQTTVLLTLCKISSGVANSGVFGVDPKLNPLDFGCFFRGAVRQHPVDWGNTVVYVENPLFLVSHRTGT